MPARQSRTSVTKRVRFGRSDAKVTVRATDVFVTIRQSKHTHGDGE